MKDARLLIILLFVVLLLGASCNRAPAPQEVVSNNDQQTEQNTPPDSDGDGLSDSEENGLGTNPNNPDTDGDGYNDGVEVSNGYSPLEKVFQDITVAEIVSSCSGGKSFLDNALCFFDKYEQGLSIKKCDAYNNNYQKSDCINGLALAKLDVNICNQLYDLDDKEDCFINISTALRDPSLCNKFTSDKLQDLARESCLYTAKEEIEQLSLGCLSGNEEYCDVDIERWWHPDLCKLLKTESQQVSCFISYGASLQTTDICKLVPLCSEAKTGACLGIPVIVRDRPDMQYNVSVFRDSCYASIGRGLWDTTGCDNISDKSEISDGKDECYIQVASRSFNLDICETKVTNQQQKECRLSVAKQASTLEQCDSFTAVDEKESCWERIAVMKLDDLLCSKITSEPTRSNCFFSLAARTGKESYCYEIKADNKINCIENVRSNNELN